jgi:hypothetical protein
VQTKTSAIVHLLDDVRVNPETRGEQKAVADHVAEKGGAAQFTLQEARNTLRKLSSTSGARRSASSRVSPSSPLEDDRRGM